MFSLAWYNNNCSGLVPPTQPFHVSSHHTRKPFTNKKSGGSMSSVMFLRFCAQQQWNQYDYGFVFFCFQTSSLVSARGYTQSTRAYYSISKYHTQLANMSFDEIFDFTAVFFIYFTAVFSMVPRNSRCDLVVVCTTLGGHICKDLLILIFVPKRSLYSRPRW